MMPMMTMSDLSQFSWRKLVCIQVLISVRQLVRMAVVIGLVEMGFGCHRRSSESGDHGGVGDTTA